MTASVPPPPGSEYEPPPSGSSQHRSPREEYRRARVRSQTVIFGSAILGMALFFLLGFLGASGALPIPFGGDFSKQEAFAEVGDTPCPTPGARAGSPEGVTLRLLNTTSTPGLAATIGTQFEELGYTIASTGNAPAFHGVGRIEAGPRGVDAAYTVAQYFNGDMRIILTAEEDETLTILLGTNFDGIVPRDEIAILAGTESPLVPLPGCLPLDIPEGGWDAPGQSGQSEEPAQSE